MSPLNVQLGVIIICTCFTSCHVSVAYKVTICNDCRSLSINNNLLCNVCIPPANVAYSLVRFSHFRYCLPVNRATELVGSCPYKLRNLSGNVVTLSPVYILSSFKKNSTNKFCIIFYIAEEGTKHTHS